MNSGHLTGTEDMSVTTINHVLDGVDSELIAHAILSGCLVLSIGYAVGQCLRGWMSARRRDGDE